MLENIVYLILGIIIILFGISNIKGNISSLHYYHRKRVTEEDRLPFGKKVGIGTMIIGCSIVLLSMMSMVTLFTGINVFATIGYVFLVMCLVVGLTISFYAMIKYNKGIF